MYNSPLLTIPALRAIVEQTLDAKVFYQDDFARSCRPTWDVAHPVTEHRFPDLMQADGLAFEVRQEQVAKLKETLASAGRGAWALVRRAKPEGGEWYVPLIHDGFGEVHARTDGWADVPTFDAVVERLVGMEVYDLRHLVEADRARAASAAVIASMRLKVGTRLRNVRVGGTLYSTAIVQAIHAGSGSILLNLTKRGSPKRYEASIPATRLAGESSPPRGPSVLVNGVAQVA